MAKRTYTLPPDTLAAFEKEVDPGSRGRVIAGLIRSWLEEKHRACIRRDVIEGCREMAQIYLKIEGEYHSLEEEVGRAIDPKPKTRGNRARASRSRRRLGTGR